MIKNKRGSAWIWILIVLFIIGIVTFIFVANSFDWWRSYNKNEINSFCENLCNIRDYESFCTKDKYYKYDGGGQVASCHGLAVNNVVDHCIGADYCRDYKEYLK